MYMLVNLRKV